MTIKIKLDDVLASRKRRAKDVASAIGVSETHMSLFRSGKVKGIRFETLEKLCRELSCRPGDLLDIDD
jgi:putative transcriptional regulator